MIEQEMLYFYAVAYLIGIKKPPEVREVFSLEKFLNIFIAYCFMCSGVLVVSRYV